MNINQEKFITALHREASLDVWKRSTTQEKKELIDIALKEYKEAVISLLIKEKRFVPLNTALEEGLFKSIDIEPYFDLITDRQSCQQR